MSQDRPSAAALVRSGAFALAHLAAVLLGRLTVEEGASLSLVWPAGGVAAVWFAAQRRAGTRGPDLAALALTTGGANLVTGAEPVLAACSAAAGLLQVLVLHALLARWCPSLWGAGGEEPLRRPRQLGALVLAAVSATAAGAALGPGAVGVLEGTWSLVTLGVWVTRGTVSVVVLGTVGLLLGARLAQHRRRRAGAPARADDLPPLLPPGRWARVELALAVVATAAGYVLVFTVLDGLPIAFPLLALTVWVALRAGTTVVALHGLAAAVTAVAFTLHGEGPFAAVADHPARALVVQLFGGLVAVLGTLLALGRDERDDLLRAVRAVAREAERRERLTQTVLDTVDVGIVVADPQGRLVLLNDAARGWHGLDARAALDPGEHAQAYGLLAPDGRPLDADEVPLRRALAEGAVDGVPMLIRAQGRADRSVVCTGRTMAAADGSPLGAVVAMHDVTQALAREGELRTAHDRLTEHIEHAEVLARASRSLATSDDPRGAICRAVCELTGAEGAYLLQPDEHGVLVSTALVGLDDVPVRLDPSSDVSLALVAYGSARPLFVADVRSHPENSDALRRAFDIASGAWQPLVLPGDRVVGVIGALWHRPVAGLPAHVPAMLETLAAEAAHVVERADLLSRLERAAQRDPLTGLANRRRWDEVAAQETARAARSGAPLTFALVDLDRFKAYNDGLGHLAGDALLRDFAVAAEACLRREDVLARWGGEEFALALPGCAGADAVAVADRVRAAVPHGQTCTVGLATWWPGETAAEALARADAALYRGKQAGRDATVVADPPGAVPALR
ncbi:sensor domain-containing diguanylate cyclase [Vallicoccus soli]|uniref:sensor domain-containing diguanylate cyclase n=1 Tax=Vallicoccus soli TaxID=2339232 RepID=UPI00105A9011|nr:sensor domain-containing diguanylate cyclase [Vallicoccus soli]